MGGGRPGLENSRRLLSETIPRPLFGTYPLPPNRVSPFGVPGSVGCSISDGVEGVPPNIQENEEVPVSVGGGPVSTGPLENTSDLLVPQNPRTPRNRYRILFWPEPEPHTCDHGSRLTGPSPQTQNPEKVSQGSSAVGGIVNGSLTLDDLFTRASYTLCQWVCHGDTVCVVVTVRVSMCQLCQWVAQVVSWGHLLTFGRHP